MLMLRAVCSVIVLCGEIALFAAPVSSAPKSSKNAPSTVAASQASKASPKKSAPKITVPSLGSESGSQKKEEDREEASIWDSKPEEISAVNVQILDKVSGKVIKRRVEVGQPLEFGGIKVTLSRCFKNAPEDPREIYAFVEISERRSIFSRWLFASSPAVNLFEHPQYDVRVEF